MSGPAPENTTLPAKTRPDRARLPLVRGPALAPIEKAAIILSAIGPALAGPFLKGLAEEDLARFSMTVAGLERVTQDVLDAVIVEFLETLTGGGEIAGGIKAARRILGGVLSDAEIARLMGGAHKSDLSVWERLDFAPIPAFASYLQMEHPQTAAVILSEIRAETAAGVLERLDREFARAIVLRLSRVPILDQRVRDAMATAIEHDFLSVLQRDQSKRRPADLIAGLMNNVSTEAREAFLNHLESREPELALDVQRKMFTFDDIAQRIGARDIPAIVRDLPEEVLLPALREGQNQGSPSVRFILENIPRRLAERYAEEIAAMPDITRKEGEAAQIEITKVILGLARSGAIKLVDAE